MQNYPYDERKKHGIVQFRAISKCLYPKLGC